MRAGRRSAQDVPLLVRLAAGRHIVGGSGEDAGVNATGSLRAEPVTADNVIEACRLAVRPDQEQFVSPVAWSLAEAYANPDVAWPRLIRLGDTPVGFVMASFDPDNELAAFRCGIWRLNVDAGHQRRGVGTFAVRLVLAEAARRANAAATVLWVDRPGGPGPFYQRLGFRPTGEKLFGETVGRHDLTP
jgi:diamine N-acetyltransferase